MVLPDQILHMLQQVTGRLGVGEWPIKALDICQDDSWVGQFRQLGSPNSVEGQSPLRGVRPVFPTVTSNSPMRGRNSQQCPLNSIHGSTYNSHGLLWVETVSKNLLYNLPLDFVTIEWSVSRRQHFYFVQKEWKHSGNERPEQDSRSTMANFIFPDVSSIIPFLACPSLKRTSILLT